MKPIFRETSDTDLESIAEFLQGVFGMPSDSLTTQADHLRWKYWQPRKDPEFWQGSRSCVVEREGTILAHAAAWPGRILTKSAAVNTVHLIDWAADASAPGAGMSVLKQMIRRSEAAIAVGGTEMTRKVLPTMGYKPLNPVIYYARPLRPLRQAASLTSFTLRDAARLARNMMWSFNPPGVSADWRCDRIDPNDLPASALPAPSQTVAVFERTPDFFRYLTECPIAQCLLYAIQHNGEFRGYFCLFIIPGVARIADAWAASEADWSPLYSLAVREALGMDGIAEIVAAAGIEPAQRALATNGFRARRHETLTIYDPGRSVDEKLSCHFQLVDSDVAFLHAGRPGYLTL